MEDDEYRMSRMVSNPYFFVLFGLFVGVNQSTFWALAANHYVKYVFVGYFGRYGPPEFKSNFHRMNNGIKDVTSNQPGKIHGKSGKEAQKNNRESLNQRNQHRPNDGISAGSRTLQRRRPTEGRGGCPTVLGICLLYTSPSPRDS